MATCAGTKKNGMPCGFGVSKEGDFCRHHGGGPISVKPKMPEITPRKTLEEVAAIRAEAPTPVAEAAPVVDEQPVTPAPNSEETIRAAATMRRKVARERAKGLNVYSGQRMGAEKRSGFHRHWINDTGAALEEMLDKGYTFVEDGNATIENDDLGNRKSLQVSKNGPPVTAYLMEIPLDQYEEDQRAKESLIQQNEISIRGATSGIGAEKDADGNSVVYNPSESGNQLLG